jgi:hypothetical protein
VSNETPRDLIARADAARRTAEMADWARTKIRLRDKPIQRGGLLRFRKDRPGDRECVFSAEETAAIYDALAIVKRDALARADALDARVTTTEGAEQ